MSGAASGVAGPRLLLLMGQSPFDTASGAAQSMRQTAELLAAHGWSVRSLATTACEGRSGVDLVATVTEAGGEVARSPGMGVRGATVLDITLRGVRHELVEVKAARDRHWEQDVGDAYEAHLERLRREFRPHVVLTFGGDSGDERRRASLRTVGATVVFALHNLAYLQHRPSQCDVFLAPSRFVADRYAATWQTDVSVLPTPIIPDGVVASSHEPVFTTFVNPEPAKGLWLVARIAERLGRERPDIPLLVVEGRAAAGAVVAAGQAAGADLARCRNLFFSPAMGRVSDLWAQSRIVLVPSVVDEAAGRVALEAMANGVVPIVSDRGALPETVGAGGFVLPASPTPAGADPPRAPVEATLATPWVDTIVRLVDHEAAWREASAAARGQAAGHLPAHCGPVTDRWFRGLLAGQRVPADSGGLPPNRRQDPS